MKTLCVSWLVFVLSLSGFAQEDSRCGKPQGNPCRDFYKRFDAFKKLQQIENSTEDVEGNLSLVEATQKNLNLNLEYTVDNFFYLQSVLGGQAVTEDTRNTFSLIAGNVSAENSLYELINSFVVLFRQENALKDAQQDFSLVMSYVQYHKLSLTQGIKLFSSVLALEGGYSSTAEANDTYQMLLKYINRYTESELFSSYESIFRAENGRADAVGDFLLVISAASKCGSLSEATKNFLVVLGTVGGYGSTEKARELFLRLYGN
jgi:hypothetical protein